MSKNISRIIIDVIIGVAIIHGWWFIALPLLLLATWHFDFYFECLLAGITYDALFGFTSDLGLRGFLGTIIVVVIFFGTMAVKRLLGR